MDPSLFAVKYEPRGRGTRRFTSEAKAPFFECAGLKPKPTSETTANKQPKLLRISLSSFGRFLMNLFAEVDGFYAEEFGGLA